MSSAAVKKKKANETLEAIRKETENKLVNITAPLLKSMIFPLLKYCGMI